MLTKPDKALDHTEFHDVSVPANEPAPRYLMRFQRWVDRLPDFIHLRTIVDVCRLDSSLFNLNLLQMILLFLPLELSQVVSLAFQLLLRF